MVILDRKVVVTLLRIRWSIYSESGWSICPFFPIKHQMNNCTLIGDRGYLSTQVQTDLFNYANIKLDTPMRNNQKNYQKQKYIFRKSRKRIETLFSQLCDQFKIRNNYAKSFNGFKTRVLSKITALTFIQFVNVFVFSRKMNRLKIELI